MNYKSSSSGWPLIKICSRSANIFFHLQKIGLKLITHWIQFFSISAFLL